MSNNKKPSEKIRVNKFLAQWAGVSRRKADDLIAYGEVTINGKKAKLGALVDPTKDAVKINKKIIHPKVFKPIYLMFNKPENVITTASDPQGRTTVMDFMKRHKERVFPVGRLDWSSEGLLLLTNDGDFSQKVQHPKNKIAKTYMVKVQGKPTQSQLDKFLKGVSTPIGKMRALHVEKALKTNQTNQWVKIIIAEGKNRQIRYMFEKLGYRIVKLKRVAIGRLKLSKLPKGTYVLLKSSDTNKIFLPPKEISFNK